MRNQEIEEMKKFLRDLGWSGTGVVIALATDFLFYIITGRLLGPELFGIFGVFMAIYYLAVGPFSHAIEMVAKKIAAKDKETVSPLLGSAFKAGLLVWAIFLLASPIIKKVFSLPANAIIVFSLVFPLAYLLAALSGTVQGREKFRLYAYYEIFSSAAKLSALGLIILGFGLVGAVIAPAIDIAAGVLIIMFLLQPRLSNSSFRDFPLLWRSLIFIFVVYAAFSIDVLLLKIFMSSQTVGIYNAVATTGKAVFFGSVAVNRAIFPKFVRNPGSRFYLLHVALLFIAAGGLAATTFLELFGKEFFTLTFGPDYVSASEFAPLYMIFITGLSAISLLGNYYLSTNYLNLRKFFVLPILETAGILLFHDTVFSLLSAITAATLLSFFILYNPVYRDSRYQLRDIYRARM